MTKLIKLFLLSGIAIARPLGNVPSSQYDHPISNSVVSSDEIEAPVPKAKVVEHRQFPRQFPGGIADAVLQVDYNPVVDPLAYRIPKNTKYPYANYKTWGEFKKPPKTYKDHTRMARKRKSSFTEPDLEASVTKSLHDFIKSGYIHIPNAPSKSRGPPAIPTKISVMQLDLSKRSVTADASLEKRHFADGMKMSGLEGLKKNKSMQNEDEIKIVSEPMIPFLRTWYPQRAQSGNWEETLEYIIANRMGWKVPTDEELVRQPNKLITGTYTEEDAELAQLAKRNDLGDNLIITHEPSTEYELPPVPSTSLSPGEGPGRIFNVAGALLNRLTFGMPLAKRQSQSWGSQEIPGARFNPTHIPLPGYGVQDHHHTIELDMGSNPALADLADGIRTIALDIARGILGEGFVPRNREEQEQEWDLEKEQETAGIVDVAAHAGVDADYAVRDGQVARQNDYSPGRKNGPVGKHISPLAKPKMSVYFNKPDGTREQLADHEEIQI